MAKTKRIPHRTAPSALLVVGAILGLSAVLRFSAGPGVAIAKEIADIAEPTGQVTDAPVLDPGIAELLEALNKREARIEERETRISVEEKALEISRREIRKNLDALEQAEIALREMVAFVDSAAESDLTRLTAMYEAMKPKEAAALFAEMPPEFSAGFLSRMRPEAAAAVLSGMAPQTAYAISVVLAGRNATSLTGNE